MADRTYWFMGSTGTYVPGRAQFDVWFNERLHVNGTPQLGAQRLVAHEVAQYRVYLYRQIYMHNMATGLVEWVNHFLPPPLGVTDGGWQNPFLQGPPQNQAVMYGMRLVDDINPGPLPNGAARPQVWASGAMLRWHHRCEARAVVGRKMYYIPHTRKGKAYLPDIDVPAGSKHGYFRRLLWGTQVQNYRARFKN